MSSITEENYQKKRHKFDQPQQESIAATTENSLSSINVVLPSTKSSNLINYSSSRSHNDNSNNNVDNIGRFDDKLSSMYNVDCASDSCFTSSTIENSVCDEANKINYRDNYSAASETTPFVKINRQKNNEKINSNKQIKRRAKDKSKFFKQLEEKRQIKEQQNRTANSRNMIFYYGKEFICILALILTTIATYQNFPPKTSRIAAPQSFFPKGSLIHDWPGGELGNAQLKVALSELSFVMFYAPWCAESQHARIAYEHIGRLFYRNAHFAAINCWQPGGECRAQYSKVMSWPVLMAYLQNGLAVPYNGKWTKPALTKFVQTLIRPVHRLTKPDDLLRLMMVHDAVIVGFINIKSMQRHYTVFLETAVRWLERDPNQEIAFAIVTGESVVDFGIEELPTIRMYLWNDTLAYDQNRWNHSNITKWIGNNLHQVSSWVSPPGSKSSSLAPFFKQGPALLLFTPRNLYLDAIDAYTMLRQIGLEYFNCPNDVNNEWIREMSREYIGGQRVENIQQYYRDKSKCQQLMKAATIESGSTVAKSPKNCRKKCAENCNLTISIATLINTTTDRIPFGPKNLDELFDDDVTTCPAATTSTSKSIMQEAAATNHFHSQLNENIFVNKFKTSIVTNEWHPRAPVNLQTNLFRKKCEMIYNNNEHLEKTIFLDEHQNEFHYDKISGLACQANKTISLIAMDSLLYSTFAERLGVNVLEKVNQTTAIIVDHENESTYVLDKTVSTNSLIAFIYDFINHKLTRHLKTEKISNPSPPKTAEKFIKPEKSSIRIREIYSDNFIENVLTSEKTVVVLFYSVQCALCSLFSQSLLHVANILNDLNGQLDFVRIDCDRNDLGWQYSMETVPSLLVFGAANQKSESRIYPMTLKVNVQNVLGFILANLSRPQRLHGLTLVCRNIQNSPMLDDCMSVLRREITDNISYSLKQWRKLPHLRSQILRRLQILQKFYLYLFEIDKFCDFKKLDSFLIDIVKVWTTQ